MPPYPLSFISSLPTLLSRPRRLHRLLTTATAENLSPTPTPIPTPRLRKRDTVDVTIARITPSGSCVGNISDDLHPDSLIPIYLPKGACPGDIVNCTITRVRRRPDKDVRTYADALYNQLVKRSESAAEVPCKHFGHFKLGGGGCGGCPSMHLPYQMQVQEKQRQVQTLYAGVDVEVREIVQCEDVWRFRNKMEFSLGRRWLTNEDRGKDIDPFAIGMHVPGMYDRIIEISDCHIQPGIANDILQYIREWGVEPYDPRKKNGYLRNVAIRSSTNASDETEVLVNFITSPCDVPDRLKSLSEAIIQSFPCVVGIVQNQATANSDYTIDYPQQRLLAGRAYLQHQMGDLTFFISPNSFFQTNSKQAYILYQQVLAAAKLSKSDDVIDLFCGTGTISLFLARYAHSVLGVDIVEDAIEDAKRNASVNEIGNVSFQVGDLEKVKKGFPEEWQQANVIVVDPPRAGLHPDLTKLLGKWQGTRLVYVSCNVTTQIRDIDMLSSEGWKVVRVQPVDMFPHTPHVECVTTMERSLQ